MKMATTLDEPVPRNEVSRRRMLAHGEHFFFSHWRRVVFFHYAVAPRYLQPLVPFELDLHDGLAYVSAVAFYLQELRPTRGGKLGALILKPIANHEFLNVRTYVRQNGETGIYFLAEFVSNFLSVQFGPRLCGLPYCYANLDYQHLPEQGHIAGQGRRGGNRLDYQAEIPETPRYAPCRAGTLDEFLLERYTAFTWRKNVVRYFRVWHPAWLQTSIDLRVNESALLAETGDWFAHSEWAGANYAPGFDNIWMGWPTRVRA